MSRPCEFYWDPKQYVENYELSENELKVLDAFSDKVEVSALENRQFLLHRYSDGCISVQMGSGIYVGRFKANGRKYKFQYLPGPFGVEWLSDISLEKILQLTDQWVAYCLYIQNRGPYFKER